MPHSSQPAILPTPWLLQNCVVALLSVAALGCGPTRNLRAADAANYKSFVQDVGGQPIGGDVAYWRFKPEVCNGAPLLPERQQLGEGALVNFLDKQGLTVNLERPRADLSYAIVTNAGTAEPVRLRVAILANADEAGLELHRALQEHGEGSWGVHRSNLAILGPVTTYEDSIAFAAKTKLACWGVFTVLSDEAVVVPGGYLEP